MSASERLERLADSLTEVRQFSDPDVVAGLERGIEDALPELIAVVKAAETAEWLLVYIRRDMLKLSEEHKSGAEAELGPALAALDRKLAG